jgi:hypothetical protein
MHFWRGGVCTERHGFENQSFGEAGLPTESGQVPPGAYMGEFEPAGALSCFGLRLFKRSSKRTQ